VLSGSKIRQETAQELSLQFIFLFREYLELLVFSIPTHIVLFHNSFVIQLSAEEAHVNIDKNKSHNEKIFNNFFIF
jgi:hypothetical protein